MKIPQELLQFTDERALIIVSAKEEGVLYHAHDGLVEEVVNVAEHPGERSDREGFFFRSGYGKYLGSGGPEENDSEENLRVFVSSIASELNEAIADIKPTVMYFFQPQHLKGYLEEAIKNPNHIPMHTVKYGNHVHDAPLKLVEHIHAYHHDEPDPSDPSSVADGPGAEEKRRILSLGKN